MSGVAALNSKKIVKQPNKKKKTKFVSSASIDKALMSWTTRWLWRNKICLCLLLIVLAIQGFLAYKSLTIDDFATPKQLNDNKHKSRFLNVHSNEVHHKDVRDAEMLGKSPSIADAKNFAFEPICNVTSKEAISALQRARTESCRFEIQRIACAIQDGKYYPHYLQGNCPAGILQANISIGCYRDTKNDRLLSDFLINYKSNNTPQRCIDICLQSGFPYAGVEYGSQCFCGTDAPPSSAKLPDSSCGMKCSGNERIVCGGYYAINIYTTGIVKFVPQNPEKSVSVSDDKKVRIAFLLTLNGRALRQVHRLIKALYAPQHSFFIHVDARQDYLYRNLLPLERKFPNILLARKRFSTIWGGSSLLTMLLQCMKDLLHKDTDDFYFDFVINLSESDFPIKTMDKLVNFLSANRNRNFVKGHGRETQRFIQKQGLDKTFVECDEHMWRIGDRQLPSGIQVDGGSDWVALSRSFVTFIVENEQTDELLKGLLLVFRHTLLPAESFFHTSLRNTPFCDTYVDNNLHFTNWKRKLGCKCQYKHVVDWCGCSPNDFTIKDLARLQATENKLLFFARKFEPMINQGIILRLEEWMNGPYATDVVNLQAYWQSFYDVEDYHTDTQSDLLRSVASVLANRSLAQFDMHKNFKEMFQLTHYFYEDRYKGFIMRYKVKDNFGIYELETRVRPNNLIHVHKACKFCQRFKFIAVSSDYDQKEQVLRNFARILGPNSEPVLHFVYNTENESGSKLQTQTFDVLWLDPYDCLQDYGKILLDENSAELVRFHKPQMKTPLLPGFWTVKVLTTNNTLIISIKFLVAPLTQIKGNPISQAQSLRLHSGANSHNIATADIPMSWYNHMKSIASCASDWVKEAINSHANVTAQVLSKWLTELSYDMFSLRESCVVNNTLLMVRNLLSLPACHDTLWSTYASDPKSDINTLLHT